MYSMLDLFAGAGGRLDYPETLDDFRVDDEECINYVFCDWIFEVNKNGITERQVRNILDDAYHIATKIITSTRPYLLYEEIILQAGNCTYIGVRDNKKVYEQDTFRLCIVFAIVHSLLRFHGYGEKTRIKRLMDRLCTHFDDNFGMRYQMLESMIDTQNTHNIIKEAMKESGLHSKVKTKPLTPDDKKEVALILKFEKQAKEWHNEKTKLLSKIDLCTKESRQNTIESIKTLVNAIIEFGEQYPSNQNDKAEVVRMLLLEKVVSDYIPKDILTEEIKARIEKLGRKEVPASSVVNFNEKVGTAIANIENCISHE